MISATAVWMVELSLPSSQGTWNGLAAATRMTLAPGSYTRPRVPRRYVSKCASPVLSFSRDSTRCQTRLGSLACESDRGLGTVAKAVVTMGRGWILGTARALCRPPTLREPDINERGRSTVTPTVSGV